MHDPTNPSEDDDQIGALVEQFLELARGDNRPTIAVFAAQHPDCAERLYKVLPMMLMVEGLAADDVEPATPRLPAPSIPEQIGDFRIIEEIGRGGMGIVFRAEQITLGRQVALKILYSLPSHQSTRLERFEQEARITARLHHTNILPVFEVGTHDNVAYFAMQFIEGQSLDRVLHELRGRSEIQPRTQNNAARSIVSGEARSFDPSMLAMSLCTATSIPDDREASSARDIMQRLVVDSGDPRTSTGSGGGGETISSFSPEDDAKPAAASSMHGTGLAYFRNVAMLIQQACEALAYAHAQGVLHRNIKPGNLLLDRNHRLWVSDFGLARELDSNLTATGEILGTLRYMAPEQFKGTADRRTDIYSLGLTFYELLTKRPAFGDSDLATDKSSRTPMAPSTIDAEIPRDLETICLKCIDAEPSRRYQSAGEVADELGRFLRGEPIAARRISPVERLVRWSQRNPIIARLTIALLVVFVAGFIGVSVMWMRAEHQRGLAETERGVAQTEERRANTALENLRLTQVVALMSPLGSLWERGNAAEVRHRLQQLIPSKGDTDQLPFEWHYWWNRLHAYDELIEFDDGTPSQVSVSTDERYLAVLVNHDATPSRASVVVWDVQRQTTHMMIASDDWQPASIDWAPGSTELAIGCTDRRTRFFDIATQQQSDSIPLPPTQHAKQAAQVNAVRFSPDGRWLAMGTGAPTLRGQAFLVERATATIELIHGSDGKQASVSALAFSTDGSRLACATLNSTVQVFDMATQQPLHAQPTVLHDGSRVVSSVVFLDNERLLATSRRGFGVALDVENNAILQRFEPNQAALESVVLSADMTWLAMAGEGSVVNVWSTDDWAHQFAIGGHEVGITGMTRFGSQIVTASRDHTVRLWSPLKLGRFAPQFLVPKNSPTVLFQALGAAVDNDVSVLLTVAPHKQVRLRRLSDGLEVWNHPSPNAGFETAAVSPQGRYVALAGRATRTQPNPTFTVRDRRHGATSFEKVVAIRAMVFSPNDELLFAVGRDGEAFVVSLPLGSMRSLSSDESAPQPSHYLDVAWSPDGEFVVTSNRSGTVLCWNAFDWTSKTITLCESRPDAVAVDQQGLVAIGTKDGMIKLHDLHSGKDIAEFRGHDRRVRDLLFIPGENRLASVSDDGRLKIWDTRTRRSVMDSARAGTQRMRLAWLERERTLLVGSSDGTIEYLDANHREPPPSFRVSLESP